jgi:hypothetical protein
MITAELILFSLFDLVFLIVLFFVLRHWFRTLFSERWPRATATITRDLVGIVGGGAVGSFFRYEFTIAGRSFAGRFLIVDSLEHAATLQSKLDGLPITIKYKPSNPKVSLLAEMYDPRFDGKIAAQNPYWFLCVRQADTFLSLNLKKTDREPNTKN